jgi:PAS domain S-box-containing protein
MLPTTRYEKEVCRFLTNHTSLIHIVLTSHGIIQRINENPLASLGYKRKELEGRHIAEFVVAEQKEEVYEHFSYGLQDTAPVNGPVCIYTKSGAVRTIQIDPTPNLDQLLS